MKLHNIAAAAAIAFVGSANALTPTQLDAARTAGTLKEVFISGASAQRLTFGAYIQEICNAADFDVYFNTNASPGNNHRAYSCTLKNAIGAWAAGTPFLIYKRDQGGSVLGVGPISTPAAVARMTVDGTCALVGPSPTADIQVQGYNCPNTSNVTPNAGLSDVEPARFRDLVNYASDAVPPVTPPTVTGMTITPLLQNIFGVAVNTKLYRSLQEAQGIIGAGGALIDMPADQTTWTAADIATMPSLSKEFVTSVLSGQVIGGSASTSKRGWNLVVPAADPTGTKSVNICRRTEGSGTQASSNLYFMQNATSTAGALTPVGCAGTSTGNEADTCGTLPEVSGATPFNVRENKGSGDVETCFATADSVGEAYALGVLGRENNPRAVVPNKAYRFVKLDGVAPIPANVQNGSYPFAYDGTLQFNTAANPAGSEIRQFLDVLRGATGMGKASTLAAADKDTQQGALALPTSITPAGTPWVDLVGNAKTFTSPMRRGTNNSFLPLRVVQ